jgi:hypothetical protein
MEQPKSVRIEIAFLLVLVGHLIFTMSVGRLMQMDEVFFKAAGREWAATGRFAAPECTGFLDLQPPCEKIWFAQPPIYMFLFGVFARVLGFGAWQCVLYDELIHLLQAWLTFRLARRIENGILPPSICLLIGTVMLFMGTVGRSDELANCFGLAGLLPLVAGPVTLQAVIVSAICLGLSAGVSIAAGGMIGIMAVSLVLLRTETYREGIRATVIWGAVSALTLLAVLAPILILYPDAYRQYLGHVNYQYNERPPMTYLMTFMLWVGTYYLIYTGLLLVVAGLCYWWNRDGKAKVHWAQLWVGPIGALIFLAINFPYKYPYLWFVGPWMLVAAAANVRALLPYLGPVQSRVVVMTTLLAPTLGASPMLRQTVIFLGLPPEQRYDYNLAIIEKIIPPGATVITNDFWWSLAKEKEEGGGPRNRVYDIGFGNPKPEEVDFYVLTQSDTGEATPPPPLSIRFAACLEERDTGPQTIRPYMRQYVYENFEIVHDNLNRHSVVIAGVPIRNSAYGYGCLILARKRPKTAAMPAASP